MEQPAPATGFNFEHASLNLVPPQPSRVRRGWERVPIKAAQRKDRTVWKRAESKTLQYETEQGGTGFAVQGTKRLRTKNVPAFPVKAGRSIDREQEAEATDDELFSRRRKSGRRSSINPARKPAPSPKSRLISAPRPSRLSANPLRSPLKNLRVMELTHSPGGNGKKARPSIGNVLGNGTPLRNAFAEPSWMNRSPGRVPLSPKKDSSPHHPFSLQVTSPSTLFSPRKDVSPQKLSTPQKVFSQQAFSHLESAPRFSPQMGMNISTPRNALPPILPIAEPSRTPTLFHAGNETSKTPVQPTPRRRSARLSGSEIFAEATSEQPTVTQSSSFDVPSISAPTGTVWLAAPETETSSSTSPDDGPSPVQTRSAEDGERAIDGMDEPSLQLQAELGAPISPSKLSMFPKQGKADQVEDEDQTKLFNDIHATFEAKDTPDRISSPRKRQKLELAEISSTMLPRPGVPEFAFPEQTGLGRDDEPATAELDGDADDDSEDEMTTRLEEWTDPAFTSPSEPEPKEVPSRSAPRFSDDTTILKAFLSRAQAKRDAQALTAATGPAARSSPRRSPRRALESVDGNSPSQPKSPAKGSGKSPSKIDKKARLGNTTPPSKAPLMLSFDPDESDELASPVKTIRRSARPKPTTATQSRMAAPSLIPLRRTDGQEPPRLRKTEAQELAIVTRSNTRRNRGLAQMPLMVLQDLSARELSPLKSRPSLPGAKAVDWNAELVEFLGEESKRKIAAQAQAQAQVQVQVQAQTKAKANMNVNANASGDAKAKQPSSKTGTGAKTGSKRTKGLGTVNGTPARARTALRPEATSASTATSAAAPAAAAGTTPARPRPRRA